MNLNFIKKRLKENKNIIIFIHGETKSGMSSVALNMVKYLEGV